MMITKTKGFSLVEMLIVIAIIAILGAMASTGWKRYVDNDNLRSAARELQADMANTKQTSVSQGLCYRMSITTGTPGNYTIERGSAACCSVCTPATTFTVIATKSPTDENKTGVKIYSTTYSGNTITFQTRGTSSTGGVTLTNNVCKAATCSTAIITSNITGKSYVTFNMQ